MIIKTANINDAKPIWELQRLSYQSEGKRYNDFTLPPLIQTFEEIQKDFEEQTVLKAVIDEKIIGSVRAHMEDGTCFVGRLIVHPECQNQGIGILLMNSVEDKFKDAERFELFTGHKTGGALHIYRKLDYREFERKELSTHTLVFLEKVNKK